MRVGVAARRFCRAMADASSACVVSGAVVSIVSTTQVGIVSKVSTTQVSTVSIVRTTHGYTNSTYFKVLYLLGEVGRLF